jgi:cobalt-zinc-cadmium efflux system membrane fusion protein
MNRITLALIVFAVLSCGRNSQESAPGEDQALELESLVSQYTLFGQNHEFFIEHDAMEAGHETLFLVHVTNLKTYKPCATGSVTIFIDGASVTSGQPKEPGIFRVPFAPGNPGVFDMEITLQTVGVSESVTDHIHVYKDHDEIHSSSESGNSHEAEAEEGEIRFLKEQVWNSDFMISVVERGMISKVIPTSGELIPAPGKINRVGANFGGIVSFANKNLVQGSIVRKGEHLFTISGKSLLENNFELQLKQARNRLETSRKAYVRHKILYDNGAVSEKQIQESLSGYTSDSLYYYSLATHASDEGLKVIAPVTGTIHLLEVSEGDFVNTGQALVTISSDQILLLRADLPQQYHSIAKDIHTANFRPAYSAETWPIEIFNGSHLTTGHSVAENDHYLPVYFELENDGRLLEGAFAEVYLKTDLANDKIAIPISALMEDQGTHYVYVQVTGESYTKRVVSTGANDGRLIEIQEGLKPGERIVSRGVILVKAASVVTGVVGHGHNH